MAKGHSFTTPRSGRNSAPYKTRIESRGGEVTSDGKDSWIFCYYDEHGKLVWRGHVNEEGVVVRDKPLEIKVDRVSKTEDDETRIKKNEVYLLASNGEWIPSSVYEVMQADFGSRRRDYGLLDYSRNGFVYGLYERMEGHPWGGLNRRKGTGLWFPRELIRFDDYFARAKAEGKRKSV